jgi:hypothetical protein
VTIRTISVAAALATVLALTACSSSTSGNGSVKPPSHAALMSIGLQTGDLPSGWTAVKPTAASSDDSALQSQVTTCEGASKVNAANRIEQVASDDYNQGNNTVSSSATSYKTQTEVTNRLAVILSSKADTCFTQAFRSELTKTLPAGATLGNIAFHITSGSSGGPSNVVGSASGTVTLTEQGQTAALYLNDVFIKGPLLGVTVQFTGIGAPIGAAVQKQVIAKVAARAAKA